MTDRRILLRAGKDPRTAVGAEASLAFATQGTFGTNIGNVLFSDAMFRLLSTQNTEVVADAYTSERPGANAAHAARVSEEFDHFVLPLANAFRGQFVPVLERLTGFIEHLTIPVTVVGVGAQLGMTSTTGTLAAETNEAVERFVRAVLARSGRIGVRGAITRDYLARLGFGDEHVEVIGCPSVYLRGPDNRLSKRVAEITSDSRIVLTATPSVKAMVSIVDNAWRAHSHLEYVSQDTTDLTMLLWGDPKPKGTYAEGMPATPTHPLYSAARMRFPLDSISWIDYLATKDYVLGTRIHGNIAALLAGTPATVLAFDSRTLELAEYHEIPYRLVNEFTEPLDVDAIYQASDWTAYNEGLDRRFSTLTRFVESESLEHVYQPGHNASEFDAAIVRAPHPDPVYPLTPRSPTFATDVVSRLRWLRQGAETDRRRRRAGAFDPPFFVAARPREVADEVTALRRELRQTKTRFAAELEELRAIVDAGKPPNSVRRAVRSVRRRVGRPQA